VCAHVEGLFACVLVRWRVRSGAVAAAQRALREPQVVRGRAEELRHHGERWFVDCHLPSFFRSGSGPLVPISRQFRP